MSAANLIIQAQQSIARSESRSAAALLASAAAISATERDLHFTWAQLHLRNGDAMKAQSALLREVSYHPDHDESKRQLRERFGYDCDAPALIRSTRSGDFPLILRPWPSSDESVYDQIFIQEEYRPVLQLLEATGLAPDIRTILDAGANIGCAALFFARHLPNAQITCLEPDDGNFFQLSRNLAANQPHKISALKEALWGCEAPLRIDPTFRDGREWARSVRHDAGGAVSGRTLRQLIDSMGWSRIDLLKIDIEGAEQSVFADHEAIRPVLADVRCIAIEIHDEFGCRQQIESLLAQIGFVLCREGELTIGANRAHLRRP